MRVPRDASEAADLLREQFDFLEVSARRYDEGVQSEAKRLAITLRILLNDVGRNSNSLLNQLGIKNSLHYLDSAGMINPANLLSSFPLVSIQQEGGGKTSYVPRLGDGPPAQNAEPQLQIRALLRGEKLPRAAGFHIDFEAWWQQPVIKDNEGRLFTRKSLVHALADTDGGGHVDAGLDPEYFAVSRMNSVSVFAGGGAISFGPIPVNGYTGPMTIDDEGLLALGSPVPASVRQIAYELAISLRNQYPELLAA